MQSDFSETVCKLEKIYGVKVKNVENFKKALTHGSYTKENELSPLEDYQRLEFLGDAVLKLCISDILYKKYPEYEEGDMSRIRSTIVSDETLSKLARKINLQKLMILGKQEEKTGGRERSSIIACTFEAILGAFYLDGELNKIANFLEKEMTPMIEEVDKNQLKFNAKAVLQEYTQGLTKQIPLYKTVGEEGPDHAKTFIVEVWYEGKILAREKGKSKKEAEQNCAFTACEKLGVKG